MLTSLPSGRHLRCVVSAIPAVIHTLQSRIVRHIWTVGATLALLILLGASLNIADLRHRAIEGARLDTSDLDTVLAEQMERHVQVIDLLLQEVQSRSRDFDLRTADAFRLGMEGDDIHRLLAERLKTLPQANAISLFDAAGNLVNTSRNLAALPHVNVADRDYFRHAWDNRDIKLFVSLPSRSRLSGLMTIFLARRISGPGGIFLGVVVAAVDVDYLLDFYKTISPQWHIAVTLLRHDGIVLARYPSVGYVGKSIPIASQWYAKLAAGGGTYRTPGYLSGARSIVAITPLHHYPLVLDVSIHDADVLAAWWWWVACKTAAAAFALASAFIVLFGMIRGRMLRQDAHNATLSRTAEALRESEARLRDFAELASDWFWEQDAELRFIRAGLGAPPDDDLHIGKRRWEVNDTSSNPQAWEKHQRDVTARRRFRDFRFDYRGPDATVRHLGVSGVPVYDRSGAFVGYRGIGRDITGEIEAERALHRAKVRAEQAEALLQDAIESISAGFIIYDTDDRLVVCNESYRRLHPADAAWLIPGISFVDVMRRRLADGRYPDAVGREQEWLEETLQEHRNASGQAENLLSNGKWILAADRRMRNGGLAGLRIDITALKQAQAALRESEIRLDRAQEIAGIGSWELDVARGEYIYSRHLSRILDLPPGSRSTREIEATRVHTDDFAVISQWLADLKAGLQREPMETRVVRSDGEARVLRVEGRSVVDADGIIRRLEGTAQDVTERRLVERQLAQAQKMEVIGNLTGGMAHDFNNVLGVIIGNLELLTRVVGPDTIASELVDEILDGATRCADLIRRLLAFARRQPLRPGRIDVNALICDTARLLRHILGQGISLRLELEPTLWPVMADPVQLEASLLNFATNARDAMPRGGQLAIATSNIQLDTNHAAAQCPDVSPGAYCLIEICDTGTGIPPQVIGQIFEPFFTTKEPGNGTGLGLAMAFGFAKQSGGHLTVRSEPGLGTTFRLYLPRNATGAVLATPPDESEALGGNEVVLLVEDNTQLRQATSQQLTELGYRVRQVAHAEAALAILLGDDRVDLLFTDVVMPGTMDGLELAYRATQHRSGLKVLLTSGFPAVRGGSRRVEDAPFMFLNKPYRRTALARSVRDVLDKDRAQPTITTKRTPDCADRNG